MNNNIVNIKVEQIYQHPENPRKDVGDVSELADSIQKNGIMQNLTVIPLSALDEEPDKQPDADSISLSSDFIVLIGHRRLAAAKQAGLAEVPCRIISKISKKEQISTMLEENMQREDLTVYEQAQGFQLMLDLGETEESIAEKTGFSKTTVKHRLNIAKLDQKVLKQKESSDVFQLSITDLYELEKIKSINKRNEVLKNATNSRDLAWKAKNAADQEKRDENEKQIVALLKATGLKAAPKNANRYDGKWEVLVEYDLIKAAPKKIKPSEVEGGMYVTWYSSVAVIREKKKGQTKLTAQELKLKQKEQDRKTIKVIAKEMARQREVFVRGILSGEIKALKDTEVVFQKLWQAIVLGNGCLCKSGLVKFLCDTKKNYYDIPKEDIKKAETELSDKSVLHQMLIGAFTVTEGLDLISNWQNTYWEDAGAALTAYTEALAEYGFSYANEEQYEVLNGTHECYVKEEA